MTAGFLHCLTEPWFVIPWYAVGALGVVFLVRDLHRDNTALKPAMKWGWPIIVFFFSVIGLALYFATARAPGIGRIAGEQARKQAHDRYEQAMWRRVNGAVIHCVAGDGLGIMTGMVIARAGGMAFWQEFWFEYLVGFAMGLFVFQRKSMTMMTDSIPGQLALALRAEFFSMLTVMGGMGAVMTYVAPMVATQQPKPLTSAFWGFGMLGLLAGYVLTWPMNFMLVKLGWKHGMGGREAAEKRKVEGRPGRLGLLATMATLGAAALVLVAWLTDLRQHTRPGAGLADSPAPQASAGSALAHGLRASLQIALDGLRRGRWTEAAPAMDAAHRAARVGDYSAPGAFHAVLDQVEDARLAYQQGDEAGAEVHLQRALQVVGPARVARPPFLAPARYRGATLIDETGAVIGEVAGTSGDCVRLGLGGWHDAWGFIDIDGGRTASVPLSALVFGPPESIGATLVMLPTTTAATAPDCPRVTALAF